MSRRLAVCSLVVMVALAGCGDDEPGGNGEPTDIGTDAGADTGDGADAIGADAAADVGEDAPEGPDAGDAGDDAVTPDAGEDAGVDIGPVDEIQLAASQAVTHAGFATAKNCADCHSNDPQTDAMRDQSGDPVGMYDLWSASMMANASRDPLWRAVVSKETEDTPGAAEVIEDTCMNCHAPMAYTAAHEAGELASIEILHQTNPEALLGLDGASCTTCHKIEPDNFGQEASFDGGFIINPDQIAYGPFANPFANPMINQSGFEPLQGDHILESAMCATCHNLTTPTLDPQGQATGETFHEQAPFTEWQNSAYNTDGGTNPQSCQSCHMPQTDDEGNPINTIIARRPNGGTFGQTGPRQPYGRHLLIGGNTLLPAILRDNADALQPQASTADFNALIGKVRDQLQNRTANVAIASAQKTADGLQVAVDIDNLTGHKFPTSFPSRRAWLHVTVRDQNGDIVFESGGWDNRGRLVDDDGQVLEIEQVGGPIEPHHDTIDDDEDVQIYEPVMADSNGQPTYTLLRAAGYYKDNRILPEGWSATFVDVEHIEPVGVGTDMSYQAGSDRVTYELDLDDTSGSFEVEVEMVYQVLGARFAAEIFTSDTQPMQVFEQYYGDTDVTP